MIKKPERKPAFYGEGQRARAKDEPKDTNPYARNSSAASWWLAGWNDTDIEVKGL